MRRISRAVFGACFGLMTLAIVAGANPAKALIIGEIEPNDTLATAQPIGSGNFDNTIIGTGDGTFDFFSFTASAGQTGRFETVAPTNFDTELFLFDSAGTLLASNDDGGAGLLSLIIHPFASADTYIIGVGKFPSESFGSGIRGTPPQDLDGYVLNATVVPLPAGLILFLSGLVALGVVGRRKQPAALA